MKSEDFLPNAPGRLVPTVQGALAFVPAPIPEGLILAPETVLMLSAAEAALGRLAGTTGRDFNPYLIGSPLLHREAILSSKIEGTYTTPEQLALLELGEDEGSSRQAADTREVHNYVVAMQRGLEQLKNIPVSLRLIRDVHSVLMDGVRGGAETPGEFRKHQNYIAGRNQDIREARFVPPPVAEMNEALKDLEAYLHRTPIQTRTPLLVQLALIHYQFETVHPFRDGNGRVGRLLIPLLLCNSGRIDSPLLYMSAYFERNREEYVDLLLRVSQKGEWELWIQFFLTGVEEAASEALKQALQLLELRQEYHRKFQKGRSSALLIRLIDRLFLNPSITILQAAKYLEVTDQAAANNLGRLQEEGIVREYTGRRRNKIFIADRILFFFG
jgi:Fic family protein